MAASFTVNPEMNAWLQRHDLSAEEFEIPDAAAAKELLRGFDWAAERTREVHGSGETCLAGLGLVVAPGHILHICPGGDGRSLVHYHFPKRQRFSVLASRVSRTWTEVPSEEVERMIDQLFIGDFEGIANRA
jgi:hypothetical protein